MYWAIKRFSNLLSKQIVFLVHLVLSLIYSIQSLVNNRKKPWFLNVIGSIMKCFIRNRYGDDKNIRKHQKVFWQSVKKKESPQYIAV